MHELDSTRSQSTYDGPLRESENFVGWAFVFSFLFTACLVTTVLIAVLWAEPYRDEILNWCVKAYQTLMGLAASR